MRKLMIILIAFMMIGSTIAGTSMTITTSPTKDITLTAEQKTNLGIASYQVVDTQVTINGRDIIKRCLISNNRTLSCFSLLTSAFNDSRQLEQKLDDLELNIITRIAEQSKHIDSKVIGTGVTTIK